MTWTDKTKEYTFAQAKAAQSAGQISQQLWIFFKLRKTRNAVIGICNRNGVSLCSRAGGFRKGRKRKRVSLKPKPVLSEKAALVQSLKYKPAEPLEPYVELAIPPHERKTILTLDEHDCRWGIGDTRDPDFHFCGKRKVEGLSYCVFHARRAFQPPQPRSRLPRHANGMTAAGNRDLGIAEEFFQKV